MDKKTKQEVKAVAKKYVRGNPNTKPAVIGGLNGLAVLVAADAMLTGGSVSVGIALLNGVIVAFNAAELYSNRTKPRDNAAGQTVESNKAIALTLSVMEEKLKKDFNAAAAPGAGELALAKYEASVHDIEADAKVLSAAFKVTAGGKYGMGTEKYEFIVWTRETSPGVNVPMTAQQGIEYLRGQEKKKLPPAIRPTQRIEEEPPQQQPKKRNGFSV